MNFRVKLYSDFLEDVENYELAKADDFKGWIVHHKLEALFSSEELIRMNRYFFRPARELIFLRKKRDNSNLYHHYWPHKAIVEGGYKQRGRPKHTEESKRKISERISELNRLGICGIKGKAHSEETKKRLSLRCKGKHWRINNEGKREWF